MAASVYVHVPFCLQRCRYCAFYSGEPLDALPRYPSLLQAELLLFARGSAPLSTVYFGGGTPALLGPHGVGKILETLERTRGLEHRAEVTLEVNPAAGADLRGLAAAGVNRLSVGVQALDDHVLASLGRTHRSAEALETIASARRAGFERVSADLMFGLADLPPERLGSCARAVVAAGATHVSTYSLELHPGTPLAAAHQRGDVPLPSRAEEEAQWEALDTGLAVEGLKPYEVSNYAAPGEECRHNLACWTGLPYLGLGPGAHGFEPREGPWGTRSWNDSGLEAYEARVAAGRPPAGGRELLSAPESFLERLFLGLRRPASMNLKALCRRHDVPEGPLLTRAHAAAAEGFLHLDDPSDDSSWTPTRLGLRRADGLAVWLSDAAASPQEPARPPAPIALTATNPIATVRP